MKHKADTEISKKNTDFGSVLAVARKTRNFTVEQVSEQLKIPVQTITALETNDIDALPVPTFTQGYIRTYARFLEIPEEKVLTIYNQAVPHELASELKPRSALKDEASSQSPMMKAVTILLVIAGLAAVLFGIINYYQEKADVLETELESKQPGFSGSSLDSPSTQSLTIRQNARLKDDELIVDSPDMSARTAVDSDAIQEAAETGTDSAAVQEVGMPVAAVPMVTSVSTQQLEPRVTTPVQNKVDNTPVDTGTPDILKIYAEKGSWMSVRDARNRRLLYNTVPVNGSKVLRGRAPFRISLGNAQSTSLLINGLAVDMTDYIRDNNTAKFTVSSKENSVIFH